MVTPDQQETLTRQLAVLQEFQLVGLDLGLISHLEDLCANDSQARDPTYELQVQCDAFRAKARCLRKREESHTRKSKQKKNKQNNEDLCSFFFF